jgi:hypothetical protein
LMRLLAAGRSTSIIFRHRPGWIAFANLTSDSTVACAWDGIALRWSGGTASGSVWPAVIAFRVFQAVPRQDEDHRSGDENLSQLARLSRSATLAAEAGSTRSPSSAATRYWGLLTAQPRPTSERDIPREPAMTSKPSH